MKQLITFHRERVEGWLNSPDADVPRCTTAEYHNIDDDWLNADMGSDEQVNAVLELIWDADRDDVLTIDTPAVTSIGGLRVQDKHGVIDGLVLYVTLTGGARIATETVWPSDMTDRVGVQAVHNVLRYAAEELSDLLEQVRKAASALS